MFLSTAAAAAVGATLTSPAALAGGWSYEGTLSPDDERVLRLKGTVCDFARQVLPRHTAEDLAARVHRAVAEYREATSFHDFWSPRIILRTTIEPLDTVYCGNALEFDRRLFYDAQSPCRRIKDLNAWEMVRLIRNDEMNEFRCVLSPCSERLSPDDADVDVARFRDTASRRYGLDPRQCRLDYARRFTNGSDSTFGYGVTKTDSNGRLDETRKDLLLESFDVS